MPVFLRPWLLRDAPALLAARWSSPDLNTQFTGADFSDEAQATDYIGNFLRFSDSAKNWAVVEDGVAVGNVGLSAIETRHQTAWASYWLAGGARGRGYAAQVPVILFGTAVVCGLRFTSNPQSLGR